MKIKIAVIALLVVLAVGVVVAYTNGWLGIVSPENRRAEAPIDDETFVMAYVELAVLAESMAIGTPEYEREKSRLLEQMGIKPGEVEAQLATYNSRPDLWHPLWEKIQAELARRNHDSGASGTTPTDSN